MRYLAAFILIIIYSCNGQKKASMANTNEVKGSGEKLTLILQDNYSGSEIEESMIIKDAKALKSFYSKINRTRKPGLPVPEIDFTKEMILIHCIGEQTSGKTAELTFVDENEDEVVVKSSAKMLEKGKTSSSITSPFSVYKMPFTQKRVTFKKDQ
jgi:hypothetical protein